MSQSDFPHLHSLMLGGLQSNRILTDLVEVWGHQLTTLKLETVWTVIPLHIIGTNCRSLLELQIINARLSIARSHDCRKESFFQNLKLIYFFLVSYVVDNDGPQEIDNCNSTPSALHCILRHAQKLEGIQATGTSSFTDESLLDIIKTNCLRNLRRFILTDSAMQHHQRTNGPVLLDGDNNQQRGVAQRLGENNIEGNLPETNDLSITTPKLTARSVIRLFEMCPHLQCTGDLRHWQISPQERRQIFKLLQNRQSPTFNITDLVNLSNSNDQPFIASQPIPTSS